MFPIVAAAYSPLKVNIAVAADQEASRRRKLKSQVSAQGSLSRAFRRIKLSAHHENMASSIHDSMLTASVSALGSTRLLRNFGVFCRTEDVPLVDAKLAVITGFTGS